MTRLCPEGEVVKVWGDGEIPAGFVWRGASHRITVHSRWRIHTNWWQQGLSVSALSLLKGGTWREYLKVTTDSGLLCLLFRDLEGASWYLARIYD
jgi:hypothetical protein